ncbi:hypothetical protein [Pseudonocardia sp.]|uniref:hypothetical protein n=1 Tax=Pseudonocardia sp. TaxID=60912 RepID=UPI003D13349C
MSADHDYSGDYGYDLLHEVRTALSIPVPRRPSPVISIRGVPFDRDPDGETRCDPAREG